MKSQKLSQGNFVQEQSTRTPRPLLRLALYPGEVYRFEAAGRGVRVRAGQAWVTHAGKDILLSGGEQAWLPSPKQDFALISTTGREPLIVEVLSANPSGASPYLYEDQGNPVMQCP